MTINDLIAAGFEVGAELYVVKVPTADLREQDINAQTLPPRKMERLVENIKIRGALESLPYCAAPNRKGPIQIVSGHHRYRASQAAGFKEIPVLLDVSQQTRSQIVAKQLAHNELAGASDQDVVKRMLTEIATPDDMLMTGLPAEVLNGESEADVVAMFAPRLDFDYRTVSFAFLPHQQADFERLIDLLEGRQDLVAAAPIEQFDELLKVAARFARIKEIRSGATAMTLMARLALEEVERVEAELAAAEAANEEKAGGKSK